MAWYSELKIAQRIYPQHENVDALSITMLVWLPETRKVIRVHCPHPIITELSVYYCSRLSFLYVWLFAHPRRGFFSSIGRLALHDLRLASPPTFASDVCKYAFDSVRDSPPALP